MRRRLLTDLTRGTLFPVSLLVTIFYGFFSGTRLIEWLIMVGAAEVELFWLQPLAGGLSLLGLHRLIGFLLAGYVASDLLLSLQDRVAGRRFTRIGFAGALIFLAGLQLLYWRIGATADQLSARVRVPILIGQLTDEERTVRSTAAQELGNYGIRAREAVPALIRTLDDYQFLGTNIRALGMIGREAREAVPALEALLAKPEHQRVRPIVEHALKEIRDHP